MAVGRVPSKQLVAPPPILDPLISVTANQANYVLTALSDTAAPRFVILNDAIYPEDEGWFVASGSGFRTWTWQDQGAPGQLQTIDKVSLFYQQG